MFNIFNELPKSFIQVPIAHRGFHDCEGSFQGGRGPENSRESIFHAVQNGLGVEIDVRFTKDYIPIVFHDNNLKRLCGIEDYLSNINYRDLMLFKLRNNEKLPTLKEILSIIDGKIPVLIEFKKLNNMQNHDKINEELFYLLAKYLGPLALMSFDSNFLLYLSKKAPQITRGIVLDKFDFESQIFTSKSESKITENQMKKIGISFISLKYNYLNKNFYNFNKRKKRNILTWTIISKLGAEKVKNLCDNITFEGFNPI